MRLSRIQRTMQGRTAKVGGCLSVVGLRTRTPFTGPMVMETRAPNALQTGAMSISKVGLRAYVRSGLGFLHSYVPGTQAAKSAPATRYGPNGIC